jgi:NAD+ diphosphatase
MLQDIFPHNFNNAYNCKKICQADDSVYIFYQDRVLLRPEGDALRLPYREEVAFAQDLTYLLPSIAVPSSWQDPFRICPLNLPVP